MKQIILVLAVILSTTLYGCTNRIADFTLLSTKNIDMSRGATFTRGAQRVEGEDVAATILIVPTGIPSVKEAIDRAIEKTPGAVALLDGAVYQKNVWFIVGGQNGFIVEGTPLIDPSLVGGVK